MRMGWCGEGVNSEDVVMEYDMAVFADGSSEGVSYTKSQFYLTYECFFKKGMEKKMYAS